MCGCTRPVKTRDKSLRRNDAILPQLTNVFSIQENLPGEIVFPRYQDFSRKIARVTRTTLVDARLGDAEFLDDFLRDRSLENYVLDASRLFSMATETIESVGPL